MKKSVLLSALAAVLLTIASCKKDDGRNYNDYTPNLTFWTAINCSPNPITVTVDSQTAMINEYFPNTPPTCGTQGCANFYLAAGTYTYSATNGDTTWNGSVTVTKGGCTLQQLYCSTGNVTFWIDSAAANIRVTMDGGTTNITTAFPTSTPPCGTQGCANFTLHIGTYNYTAITTANIGYSGTVRVSKDSCSLVKIY